MSSAARPEGRGWAPVQPRSRPRLRRDGYGSRWQRMRRQVWTVIRHEMTLSLHLLLLVMSVIAWAPRLGDDWTLWVALDQDIVIAAFLYTLVACTVAFLLGQRDVRNAVTEIAPTTVASRRDVVLARMIGMVFTSWLYLTVLVGGVYLLGVMAEDWGRPDVRILLPMYVWPLVVTPLMVALGNLSTRTELLRPIMWVVIVAVAGGFVHILAWFAFAASMIEALPWPPPPPNTVVDDSYQASEVTDAWRWLTAGIGALGIALFALPSRFGHALNRARSAGIATLAVMVVAVALSTGIGFRNPIGIESRVVTGDLTSCHSGDLYVACGHPAYDGMIDGYEDDIAAVLEPIKGVDTLPIRIEFVPVERLPVGDPFSQRPLETTIVHGTQQYANMRSDSFQTQFIQQVFTRGGWVSGDGTVRNVVEAWWMLELGFTPESSRPLAFLTGDAGESPSGYVPPDLTPYIDRFASLPEEERPAWLGKNWDSLRAGELTLEDLP